MCVLLEFLFDIHAEQLFTTKSVTIFYIVALCFSVFDLYYNWFDGKRDGYNDQN